MQIDKIGIIGAGMMGAGIAQLAAQSGFNVNLVDVSEEALLRARKSITEFITEGIARGKYPEQLIQDVFERIEFSKNLPEAVKDCELIIESVFELPELKQKVFLELEKFSPETAILATNTSSISIAEIASVLIKPERVVGMHFNSPVPISKIVEIIHALQTSTKALDVAKEVVKKMGKEQIIAKDYPGFVPSRIGATIVNHAFYELDSGVASAEDIDKAIKLTFNHPMGPFELADYIGLDTILKVLTYLHKELGEMYRPCPLLVQYVKAGLLGRKVGRGIYNYGGQKRLF